MVLSGAVAFGAQATAHKAKVNFQESLARVESTSSTADLVIDADEAIDPALDFDPGELGLQEITLAEELKNKYGDGNISLETGEFTPFQKEEVPPVG